jgi:ABC-2 type transport system permease protein
MALLAIKKIFRYLKIYKLFIKFDLLSYMVYRSNFFIYLFLSTIWNIGFIFFYYILYGNIKEIAGWNYYEMLMLTGVSLISGGIIDDICYGGIVSELPSRIKDGDIDFALLKPIHSMFNLTLKGFSAGIIINVLPGIFLVWYALNHTTNVFNLGNIFSGIIILICGLIIFYSILVSITSLAFLFNTSTDSLPKLAREPSDDFATKPHTIFNTLSLKAIFYIIFPIVFINSIPASTILKGVDYRLLILAIVLAIVFLTATIKFWNRMIRHYSSASS